MTDVEPPRSPLITFFFNVHRRFRSGHFHGFQRIRIFSPFNLCLPIWIIYFGECPPKWRIITLLGFSGIYGKVETIKFLAIWIWIPEILSNWQKRNRYFGRKHKTLRLRVRTAPKFQYLWQYRVYQVDGVLRTDLGKQRINIQGKDGTVPWKVTMD